MPHHYVPDGPDCAECPLPAHHPIHEVPDPGPPQPALPAVDTNHTPVGLHHPMTSHKAAARALPRSGSHKARIFDLIASRASGYTDDELEVATGLTHQSASAARNSLMGDGLIEPLHDQQGTITTRPTRTGNDAQAWTPTAGARHAARRALQ